MDRRPTLSKMNLGFVPSQSLRFQSTSNSPSSVNKTELNRILQRYSTFVSHRRLKPFQFNLSSHSKPTTITRSSAETGNGVDTGNGSVKHDYNYDDDDDNDDYDDDDYDEEDETYHPSWDIYEKPGNLCVVCDGKGHTKCLYCYGKGYVSIGPEPGRDTIVCPVCNGTKIETCMRCEGTGIRPDYRWELTEDGEIVKVPNLTNEQVSNLPAYIDSQDYQDDLERSRQIVEKRKERERQNEIEKEKEKQEQEEFTTST